MSFAISRRDRRTLLAGAAVVAALVALTRGLPAWRDWDVATRAAAVQTVEEAARAERSVRTLPAVRDTLVARSARYLALADLVVPGDGPASAAGELATFVGGTATAANLAVGALQVRIDSADDRPPVPSGGSPFVRVSVRGDAMGDVDGLTHFLAAVERGPFLLVVRELVITQPEPAAEAARPEMLLVQFLVEGISLRARADTSRDGRREKGGRR